MAEEKTFTQEEVNKLVGQARLEGKDAGRKEFEGWISPDDFAKRTEELNGQLTGLNDQIKTLSDEKTDLQSQLTEKDGQIAKYEIDSVKTRIAREYGLSYEAIGFLQGNDEDAIKASAESLKNLVGNAKTPPLGNPETPPEEDGVTAAFKKYNPNIKV
jgi:chromosome segregation ATPase